MRKKITLLTLLAFSCLAMRAQTIKTVAGGSTSGYSGDNSAATAAQLSSPIGVAFDKQGNMYIVDQFNSVIRKVTATGIIITVVGDHSKAFGYSGDHGPAPLAGLSTPSAIAFDTAGNMYISDNGNNVIRKVTKAGVITTVAGSGDYGYGGDNGPALSAQFAGPAGLAVDAAGNIFIADQTNNVVRKVSASGTITTIAGTSASGFSGDNGPATAAKLNGPAAVALDAAGNLFIADQYNGEIRKVTPAGTITTVAGSHSKAYTYSGDNSAATAAGLNSPAAIIFDTAGNMYISDNGNNVVRKIDKSGIITTVAGNGDYGYGGDNGPALSAQFSGLVGIAITPAGNLFIADQLNNRVREVTGITPLAIVLTNIAATNEGKTNSITWKTAQENIGDRFELEHSTDASTFISIAGISGKGPQSSYQYTDEAPLTGTNYYRLHLLNADGQSSYSQVVSALVKGNGAVVKAYPNPATNTLNLTGLQGESTYSIVDVVGRPIINGAIDATTGNVVTINIAALTNGIYFLHYKDETRTETIRFVKK